MSSPVDKRRNRDTITTIAATTAERGYQWVTGQKFSHHLAQRTGAFAVDQAYLVQAGEIRIV